MRTALVRAAKHSLRSARHQWLVSSVVVISLSLGFAVAARVFRSLDVLFWRDPPGLLHPGELRRVRIQAPPAARGGMRFAPVISYPDFHDLAAAATPAIKLAAYVPLDVTVQLHEQAPVPLRAVLVSNDYFSVLGVQPIRGRLMDRSEFDNDEPVAVLSSVAMAKLRRLNPAFDIGATIGVGDVSTVIIGEMGGAFAGLDHDAADLWMPVGLASHFGLPPLGIRSAGMLSVVGRMASTTTAARTERMLSELVQQNDRATQSTAQSTARKATVASIREDRASAPDARSRLLVVGLTVICAVALIVAIGNALISMLIAVLRRTTMYATRVALGATPAHLLADHLVETVPLILVASALGLALGLSDIGAPAWFRDLGSSARLDARMIIVAAAVTAMVLVTLVAAPLRVIATTNLSAALRSVSSVGGLPVKVRAICLALMSVQVTVLTALTVATLSLGLCLQRAYQFDYGFRVDDVYAISISPGETVGGNRVEGEQQRTTALARRLAADRTLRSVSLGDLIPFRRTSQTTEFVRSETTSDITPLTFFSAQVDTAFFGTMGIRLVRGRLFAASDLNQPTTPVVISETLAATIQQTGDVLGECFPGTSGADCRRIVGIVADASVRGLQTPAGPMRFTLVKSQDLRGASILVRARDGVTGVASAVYRDAIAVGMNPSALSVLSVRDMSRQSSRDWRTALLVFGISAAVACLLSVLGTMAIIAYEVSSRMHELGIRSALGASGYQLGVAVGRRAITAAVVAVVLGCVIGMQAVLVMRGAIVGGTLPVGLPVVVAGLAGIAITFLTVALPARSAIARAPMHSLRAD